MRHRRGPFGVGLCDAGFSAFFGGRWPHVPCTRPGRNRILTETSVELHLCDEHFGEVNAAGLVTDPYQGVGEEGERELRRKIARGDFRDR